MHRTLQQRPGVHIHVLDALTYAGNPLNLCDSHTTPLERIYPGRFQFTHGDITDATLVDALVRDLGKQAHTESGAPTAAVVHFAAESHNDNSLHTPEIFARTNIEGTIILAHAAARHGIYLHHISTDEVFGDLALDEPRRFQPDSPYRPSSPYSASKAAADHFIRAFIRSLGLRATISNCSNNYGPRQHPEKFIPRQITGLLCGEQPRVYGAGLNVRDWIHVDDHNDAVWQILEHGEYGRTYLIGADGEHSNLQVIKELLKIFDKNPEDYIHVSDRPGHDRRYAIDPTSIRSLGWRPAYTHLRQGLRATVQWYENHHQWWEEARVVSEKKYQAHQQ